MSALLRHLPSGRPAKSCGVLANQSRPAGLKVKNINRASMARPRERPHNRAMSARDIIGAVDRQTDFVVAVFVATLFVTQPAAAQSPLSLSDAIARA